MRRLGVATAMVILLASSRVGAQQQAGAPAQAQSPAEAGPARDGNRTSRQRLLDEQAERLVIMANELKAAVDKTNKNILSMDVVRKAEEIESLARKMKDQGKK